MNSSNYTNWVPEMIIVLAWPNIFITKWGFLGKVKSHEVRSTGKKDATIELMHYFGAYLRKQAWLIFLFDGIN